MIIAFVGKLVWFTVGLTIGVLGTLSSSKLARLLPPWLRQLLDL